MANRTPTSTSTPSRRRTTRRKVDGAAPAPLRPALPSVDDIRVRAYHRYLERGGREGGDFDDWLEAEKDLKTTQS
jgi:hypothetical protein